MSSGGDADSAFAHADLLAAVAWVVAVLVVAAPVGAPRPVRLVVGLGFVLFVPGYALVAAAFPRAGETGGTAGTATAWISRLLLGVAGSVIVVAAVGVALEFTIWGFGENTVLRSLALVSFAGVAVAWFRRRSVEPAVRAGVDVATVGRRTKAVVVGTGPVGVVLSLLVLAMAAGGLAVVAEDATSTGSVTAFYALGTDESGDLVAGNYPSTLTAGEPTTLGIGVETTDPGGFDGTVVVTLERVAVDDDSVTVTSSRRLDSFDVQVDAGARTVRRHTVRPTRSGSDLRLTYRLFAAGEDAPLRRLGFPVDVTPASPDVTE